MPLEGTIYGYQFRRLSGFGRGIASPQARISNTALCFNTGPLSEKIQSRCGTLSALALVCACQVIAADFHTSIYISVEVSCRPEQSWNKGSGESTGGKQQALTIFCLQKHIALRWFLKRFNTVLWTRLNLWKQLIGIGIRRKRVSIESGFFFHRFHEIESTGKGIRSSIHTSLALFRGISVVVTS